MGRKALIFQPARKGLLKLLHLGAHHKGAITLAGVVGKIVLVIVLSRPVLLQRLYLGDDGCVVSAFVTHFFDQIIGNLSLRVASGVDAAAVLRAHIVALPVQGRRVVGAEKNQQHIAQADDGLIKLQLHYLGMAGLARADIFVAGWARWPLA